MTPMRTAWTVALPFLVAAALVYILDLGAPALGAALGVAAFAALLIARRPVSVKLGALALGGAFALGLSAAIFSALLGQSVLEMANSLSSAVGVLLAVGALLLAVLGSLSIVWGVLTSRPE